MDRAQTNSVHANVRICRNVFVRNQGMSCNESRAARLCHVPQSRAKMTCHLHNLAYWVDAQPGHVISTISRHAFMLSQVMNFHKASFAPDVAIW